MTELNWDDARWAKVRGTVHDEAMRARVAASFLPLYGPLADDALAVPANRLSYLPGDDGRARMSVEDYETLRLCTVAVNVQLGAQQAADPALDSALIMFRRAADIVARIEDALVFNGQPRAGEPPVAGMDGVMPVYTVTGGGAYPGLLDAGEAAAVRVAENTGQAVFAAVVEAIGRLEGGGHLGPFACVLGETLFVEVMRPVPNSMVLPRDSILPFLQGPLLRSSAMPAERGVVVSLQGEPVEIVMAKDIGVRFLQTTAEAKHVFRVAERFVLRIKEAAAVVTLRL